MYKIIRNVKDMSFKCIFKCFINMLLYNFINLLLKFILIFILSKIFYKGLEVYCLKMNWMKWIELEV